MIAALILAAGARRGSGFDPLDPLGYISALQRLILVFKQGGAGRVVVVSGAGDKQLERHVQELGVVSLQNPNPVSEMMASVKIGLSYLTGLCTRVLVTPADVPLFSPETVRVLGEAQGRVAVPAHDGKTGHPMMLSAALFEQVIDYGGPGGLSGAIRSGGWETVRVPVRDEGVLLDVRKSGEEQYKHLIEGHSLNRTRAEVKLFLAKQRTFFTPESYFMLSLLQETNSLRLTCSQMGISYSKGWRLIEEMEQEVGHALVERKRGGVEKGSSSITPYCRDLMRRYGAMLADCEREAQRLFLLHFGEEDDSS